MILDIIFLVVIVVATIKGIQRGFIVAIFSIVAIIIGLAAAMKLSTVVAEHLSDSVNISAKWLPLVSFLLVFLGVVLLVRLIANVIQKTVEIAFLGWANRIAGAILYILLYTIVFSVLLFFAEQLQLVKKETIADSRVYPWVEPVGPYVLDGIGKVVPWFKDMFEQLKRFFENMTHQVTVV